MADLKSPKVSICIPLYNQEDLIIRALNSIPKRDDIEIILVDDNSTDKSLDRVLDWWVDNDVNMRVIHNTFNKGVSKAYNRCYDSAIGEYIYHLDDDDYLLPEWEKCLEYLDGTDLVYINAQINNGEIYKPSEENHNFCAMWFKFIRRAFLGDLRRPENVYGGDYELNLTLLSKPHTFVYTDILAYHYNRPRVGSIIWKIEHNEL